MYTYNFKDDKSDQIVLPGAAKHFSFDQDDRIKNLKEWSFIELAVFRVLFVFFLIQIVPWHPAFYQQVFSINWLNPSFKSLLDLVTFLPTIVSTPTWGAWSFSNWFIYLAISVLSAIAWGHFDKSSKQYYFLHYLLRAVVRYKLSFSLIAYGFYLLFQQHMPYPSLSNLHTNYGDLFAWKLYFQTTAINPAYESFLGFVEILAAFLILYPKTVTFGTGLVLGFLGNVAMVNLFYDVGDHVYVNFLLVSSAFLFSYDIPRLYALLVKGTKAVGEKFYPLWETSRLRNVRRFLRGFSLVFLVLIGFIGAALVDAPYKVPQADGIKGSFGYYIPTTFKLNNEIIPYSTTDPNRWQDVIFEKWSTISIKINRPILMDISNGDGVKTNDLDRDYEIAGAGGRHYFSYKKDPSKDIIYLQNKNINHRTEKLNLRYSFPSDSTMVLEGTNEKNENLYVELLRIDKKYFMYEGRRGRIKL
jgi:hypothetical protein